MTGSEVFNLTRRQLEQYCGVLEGSKLYSEISTARIESEVSYEVSKWRIFQIWKMKFFIFTEESSNVKIEADIGESSTKLKNNKLRSLPNTP